MSDTAPSSPFDFIRDLMALWAAERALADELAQRLVEVMEGEFGVGFDDVDFPPQIKTVTGYVAGGAVARTLDSLDRYKAALEHTDE